VVLTQHLFPAFAYMKLEKVTVEDVDDLKLAKRAAGERIAAASAQANRSWRNTRTAAVAGTPAAAGAVGQFTEGTGDIANVVSVQVGCGLSR